MQLWLVLSLTFALLPPLLLLLLQSTIYNLQSTIYFNLHYLFSLPHTSHSRMEVAELHRSAHFFFLGAQFHPEYSSRPDKPSPLIYAFVAAASINNIKKQGGGKGKGLEVNSVLAQAGLLRR
jgi:hypothetical protein